MWTLVAYYAAGAVLVLMDYTRLASFGTPERLMRVVSDDMLWWTLYAVSTPPIFWIVRRYPLTSGRLKRDIVYYVAAVVVTAIIHTALTVRFVPGQAVYADGVVINNALSDAFFGTILISVLLGLQYYKASYENSLRAADLEISVARAQLQALSANAQPAVLCTALNAVASLACDDPPRTERSIVMLSEFLRNVLQRGVSSDVPLEREFRLLEQYSSIIEAVSYGRCRIVLDVHTDARLALVPPLLCQGVLHAPIARALSSQSQVDFLIRATRNGDKLLLEFRTVSGTMPLVPIPGVRGAHHEIADRLSRLYGRDASLVVDEDGAIELTVPFRLPIDAVSQIDEREVSPVSSRTGPSPVADAV